MLEVERARSLYWKWKIDVKQEKRDRALPDICASFGWEESEAVEQKIEDLHEAEDAEEMAEIVS